MNRRQAVLFVGAVILVGLVVGALWIRSPESTSSAGSEGASSERVTAATTGSVTLYFPGDDGRLHPELRGLDTSGGGDELVRRIVTGLLSGPDTEGLYAPLPQSTEVASVLLSEEGVLFLDLASTEHALPPVAGSQREILAAYSLVNSICNNVPRIRGVSLLWNGEQRTTFAGNLDTTHPLTPNERLVSAG